MLRENTPWTRDGEPYDVENSREKKDFKFSFKKTQRNSRKLHNSFNSQSIACSNVPLVVNKVSTSSSRLCHLKVKVIFSVSNVLLLKCIKTNFCWRNSRTLNVLFSSAQLYSEVLPVSISNHRVNLWRLFLSICLQVFISIWLREVRKLLLGSVIKSSQVMVLMRNWTFWCGISFLNFSPDTEF